MCLEYVCAIWDKKKKSKRKYPRSSENIKKRTKKEEGTHFVSHSGYLNLLGVYKSRKLSKKRRRICDMHMML